MRTPFLIASSALALAGAGADTLPGAGSAGAPDGLASRLVQMREISVPIIDGDRLDGTLRVKLVLAAANDEAVARVRTAMPRLRSTTLAAALEFARLHASPMRAVDAEMLTHDLTGALHRDDTGIAQVLIVEVAARPA